LEFHDLVRRICNEYKLKEEDLISISRNRYASEATQVIGWLALKMDNITLTDVAKHFGRVATTVRRAMNRLEAKIKKR